MTINAKKTNNQYAATAQRDTRMRARTSRAKAASALLSGAIFFLAGSTAPAFAASLSYSMTADNAFDAYISTSNSVNGTRFATGNSWGTTYSGSTTLTPNQQYYLHVRAVNWGGPAGFIGNFTLSDTSFRFANNLQQLVTNKTDWKVSATGFGQNMLTPTAYGANGAGPWGTRSGIPSYAQWIWTSNTAANALAYFSTPITPVPLPATAWLLASGLGLMAFVARRRRMR